MSFKEKIVYLRNSRNLTQPQLATNLKCSVGTVSNWECGKTIPNADQLSEAATFFGVSTDFLLDREEFTDPDIRSIQRAMVGMDSKRRNEMKTMLSIAFAIDFGED